MDKYFVASNGNDPLALFFSREDAFASGFVYLDTFDDVGKKVKTFKLVNTQNGLIYTTEF